jgi:hypothetical protein
VNQPVDLYVSLETGPLVVYNAENCGGLAQLGEHYVRNVGVGGSTPLPSTILVVPSRRSVLGQKFLLPGIDHLVSHLPLNDPPKWPHSPDLLPAWIVDREFVFRME